MGTPSGITPDRDIDPVGRLVDITPGTDANLDPTDTWVFQEKDSDGDGLSDWDELRAGLDPHKADTDGDGVLDTDEVPDADHDRIPDAYESGGWITDPDSADTDGDGVDDWTERNTYVVEYTDGGVPIIGHRSDAQDADSDDDGRGDAQELREGTNPRVPDLHDAQLEAQYVPESDLNAADLEVPDVLAPAAFAPAPREGTDFGAGGDRTLAASSSADGGFGGGADQPDDPAEATGVDDTPTHTDPSTAHVAIDHALPQSAVLTDNDGDTDGASNSTADSAGDADPDGAAADREPELDLVE